jgi:hypothetical protein
MVKYYLPYYYSFKNHFFGCLEFKIYNNTFYIQTKIPNQEIKIIEGEFSDIEQDLKLTDDQKYTLQRECIYTRFKLKISENQILTIDEGSVKFRNYRIVTLSDIIYQIHNCLLSAYEKEMKRYLEVFRNYSHFNNPENAPLKIEECINSFVSFVKSKNLIKDENLYFEKDSILKKITLDLIDEKINLVAISYEMDATKSFLKKFCKKIINAKQIKQLTKYESENVFLKLSDSGDLIVRVTNYRKRNRLEEYGHDSDGFENLIPPGITNEPFNVFYILDNNGNMTPTNSSRGKDNFKFVPLTYFLN